MEGTIVIPKLKPNPEWANSFIQMTDKFYLQLAETGSMLGSKLTNLSNNLNVNTFVKGFKKLQDSKFIKERKRQLKNWFKQYLGNDPVSKEKRKEYKQFLKNLRTNLKNMGNSLKGILKAVYGNWFSTLLKLLLFMSIFDPKGKFLSSILGFLVKMVLQLMDIIIGYLPMIIKNLINIITTVLPRVLNEIIDTVFSWISSKFQKLVDQTDSPVLKWIFQQLADAFGKDGFLTGFFKSISKYLVPIFIGLGVLSTILPVIMTIFGVLGTVFSVMSTVIGGIMTVVTAIGAIPLLIIGAIVAIGIVIYKYRKEIKEFFVKSWNMAKNLLTKTWTTVKNFFTNSWNMAKNLLTKTWTTVKNFFKAIPGTLKDFGKMVLGYISVPFKKLYEFLKPIFDMIARIFKPVGEVLSKIWSLIKNTIMRVINGIVDSFKKVMDFFAMFGDLSWSQLTSAEARTTYMETRQIAREKGIDMGKVEKAIEGEKGIILNSAEKQMVQQLGGYQGEDFGDKMQKFIDDKEAINKVSRIKGVDINKTPED